MRAWPGSKPSVLRTATIRGSASLAHWTLLGRASLFNTPTMNSTWWYMGAAVSIYCTGSAVYTGSRKKFGYNRPLYYNHHAARLPKVGLSPAASIHGGFLLARLFGHVHLPNTIVFRSVSQHTNPDAETKTIWRVICFLFLLGLRYWWVSYLLLAVPHSNVYQAWELHYAIAPVDLPSIFCKQYIIRIPVVVTILQFFWQTRTEIFSWYTTLQSLYLLSGPLLIPLSTFALICLVLLWHPPWAFSIVMEGLKKSAALRPGCHNRFPVH